MKRHLQNPAKQIAVGDPLSRDRDRRRQAPAPAGSRTGGLGDQDRLGRSPVVIAP